MPFTIRTHPWSRKSSFLLVLFTLGFSHLIGQGDWEKYDQFPSFEEVVTTFYERYAPPTKETLEFHYLKDETGYSVFLRDRYTLESKGEPQLFWSLNAKEYQEVNLARHQMGRDPSPYRDADLQGAREYNRHPFFGYPEWPEDVIRVFSSGKDLSSQQLNGLARAYSASAEYYIHSRSARPPSDRVLKYLEEFDPDILTEKDMQTYQQKMESSIQAFKVLELQDPTYPLVVGTPRVKIANQYMTAYLDLVLAQKTKLAEDWIKDDIYPEIYLEMAAAMLNSCPQDAFLFTNGDNDTFPLWYLQKLKKTRTDVTVINLSLLNDATYVRFLLKDKVFGDRVKLGLPFEAFKGKELMVFPVEGAEKKKTDPTVEALRDEINGALGTKSHAVKSSEVVLQTPGSDHAIWEQLPSDSVRLDNMKAKARRYGSYWFRQDIFLLDLLATNNWERPVCFSGGVHPQNLMGMEEFLWLEGAVSRLYPAGSKDGSRTSIFRSNVNLKRSVNLFVDTYEFDKFESWDSRIKIEDISLRKQFRYGLIQTLDAQDLQKDYDATPVLLDIFINHFMYGPERTELLNTIVAKLAIHSGMNARARTILDPLYNYSNRLHYLVSGGREKSQDKVTELARFLQELQPLYEELGEQTQVDNLKRMYRQLQENNE